MILPGNVFIKKIEASFWIQPAMVLMLLNVAIHLVISLTEAPTYNLEADIQQIKKKSNLKLMNSMHLQAQDPIVKSQMAAKIDLDPYLFIKDIAFWQRAQTMTFNGDQVQVEKNKQVLQHLKKAFENSTQQIYGLSQETPSPMNWITYQFTHASVFHLFSNILFMFLIITILQSLVSTYWIATVYLLSGLASGLSYILFCDDISLPLVGASGSVSGLIAFLAVLKGPNNIVWSYFISPLPNGFGKIFLPAYLLFPIYLLADFTSVLIDTQGISGSVAHSAHIGGALCGLTMGFVFHYYQQISLKVSTLSN